jgi:hypothetical protein
LPKHIGLLTFVLVQVDLITTGHTTFTGVNVVETL